MSYRLILASASPRRKEILAQAGICFEIIPSEFEEKTEYREPETYVKTLADGKAEAVAKTQPGPVLVLGADTIVAHQDRILTKPADRADAFRMLKGLQGDTHAVYTGVALYRKEENGQVYKKNFAVKTQVVFYPMSDDEIEGYLDLEEYTDKAGAYAIQGRSAVYIREIQGDYYNVVGLPLSAIIMALKDWGIALEDLTKFQ